MGRRIGSVGRRVRSVGRRVVSHFATPQNVEMTPQRGLANPQLEDATAHGATVTPSQVAGGAHGVVTGARRPDGP